MNKKVLITGTSQGLGRAIAEQFLEDGAFVFGCSRGRQTINHDNYCHFTLDISNDIEVLQMFKDIKTRQVPLDLLINNASLLYSSAATLSSASKIKELIDINLIGTFFVTREALKLMQYHRYGRIINFSSINVASGWAGGAIYNASKAGVAAMSKSLVRECIGMDITINTLGLSFSSKGGMTETIEPEVLARKQMELIKPNLLEVDEIMHAIDFFSSPLAKNISCQTLYFGGL